MVVMVSTVVTVLLRKSKIFKKLQKKLQKKKITKRSVLKPDLCI